MTRSERFWVKCIIQVVLIAVSLLEILMKQVKYNKFGLNLQEVGRERLSTYS
jgi:hypothetical protein